MIGETLLNRYKIESELGKGGMGIVYEAHDTLLNRVVAIKFLNTEGVGTEGKARLLQEARAAAQLNHPNIVSVYDAGETAGNPFIVMELVRGDTLRKANKPAFAKSILMAQQICLALDHAHTHGIIHRDLKLENIVITNSQTLKLMDFGLARTTDDAHLTQEGALIGTLAYIAPELIQGQPASAQSDLYALGVIIYELLVGHEPFQGNIGAVLGQHLHGPITPPSKFSDAIPDWVDELVLGLLSKRPEDRPSSARAVLDILEQKITPPVTAAYKLLSKPRNNLPAQSTSFIGREKEIKEIMDALHANRLVTLAGSGGTGKTRLSLQVAAEVLEQFDHGVWFVEFAPLTDPDLIPQTILSAIGISEQQGKLPIELLKEYLYEKRVLIVLDNCEHLIEASAQVVNILLSSAPEIKILTSSREALGVIGELSYHIPSLSLPNIKRLPTIEQVLQYEAVRLFIDRARLVSPHFEVNKENALYIAQICHRLDGIPLALELAATRVKMLSVDQILKRLNDRFRLLTGGARTALPRQQTLRATIDWSYNLLSEHERTLLRRLAVFIGSWTLEAAEEVCNGDGIEADQILDLMSQLVNKSLVAVDEHSKSGETRYRILETVRQYAREKLFDTEEASPLRDKHLAYFMKWTEQAEHELYRSNQVLWYQKLDDELDNIRTALEWALASNISSGLRIILILQGYLEQLVNIFEVWNWLIQFLEQYLEMDSLRARALTAYGVILANSGDLIQAQIIATQGLELSRQVADKRAEAFCLHRLGVIIGLRHGDIEKGIPIAKQSLALYQLLGDKSGQVHALGLLALIASDDLERSKSLRLENLRICRELGDLSSAAGCLGELAQIAIRGGDLSQASQWLEELKYVHNQFKSSGLREGSLLMREQHILDVYGSFYYWQGDYNQAVDHFEEAINISKKAGFPLSYWDLTNLAYAQLGKGDTAQAKEKFILSTKGFQEGGVLIGVVFVVEGLARLCINQNQPERAARLFAWTDATRDKIDDHRWPVEKNSVDKDLAVIHSKVSDDKFTKLYEEGRAMTTEQAIALALEEE